MRDALFQLDPSDERTLQAQVQDLLTQAIINEQLMPGAPVPSTRAMSQRLGISRNTVTLAYQALVFDGFLKTVNRSGYYVDEEAGAQSMVGPVSQKRIVEPPFSSVNLNKHFVSRPSLQAKIKKPTDWRSYPFPFIYGQTDPSIFPIAEWRDCTRQAMGKRWVDTWISDHFAQDDPMLIDQIRRRVLLRRGIYADEDEILITLGAQNALYLLANLFVDRDKTVAIENPGYPDARNIFQLQTDRIKSIPVDFDGLVVDDQLNGADVIFTTPSHQSPTTVTMPLARRWALLAKAHEQGAVIIEDDYEFETNYVGEPCPALKSLDEDGRVVYVGSLSKSVMHGLRLGFIVASPEVIAEARALRKLVLRHPPGNNQRTMAQFLANGHHDRFIHRLHRVYRERWSVMEAALARYFEGWSRMPSFGGSSVWVTGPDDFDADKFTMLARDNGIFIEPGSVYFSQAVSPCPHFRLGFSCIPTDRIDVGIKLLAKLAGTI